MNSEGREVGYAPDPGLREAAGDTDAWAAELARMVREIAGVEFDDSTFVPWLLSYRQQVRQIERQAVLLRVANFPVDVAPEGLVAAMRYRNGVVEGLLA